MPPVATKTDFQRIFKMKQIECNERKAIGVKISIINPNPLCHHQAVLVVCSKKTVNELANVLKVESETLFLEKDYETAYRLLQAYTQIIEGGDVFINLKDVTHSIVRFFRHNSDELMGLRTVLDEDCVHENHKSDLEKV